MTLLIMKDVGGDLNLAKVTNPYITNVAAKSGCINHHGEITPCQVEHHVRTKFATPILYAIDNFKNYDFFSTYT